MCSTQTVSVLVVLQNYPPLRSKATLLLVFLFYEQPNYQFRSAPCPILLIPDTRLVHQQAPGSCGVQPHTSASIDSKSY